MCVCVYKNIWLKESTYVMYSIITTPYHRYIIMILLYSPLINLNYIFVPYNALETSKLDFIVSSL